MMRLAFFLLGWLGTRIVTADDAMRRACGDEVDWPVPIASSKRVSRASRGSAMCGGRVRKECIDHWITPTERAERAQREPGHPRQLHNSTHACAYKVRFGYVHEHRSAPSPLKTERLQRI